MGIIIAMISGALMSIQGVWNTQVTKMTGMWVANLWVQFTAFLLCTGLWVVMDRDSIQTITKVEPKFMLAGGDIGSRNYLDSNEEYRRIRSLEGNTYDSYYTNYRSLSHRNSGSFSGRETTS